jgi:hypothetical protein
MRTQFISLVSALFLMAVSIVPSHGQSSFTPSSDFGVELSSSFSTGFGRSSLFSQSVAPHMQWSVSPRWKLTVGSIFTNYSGNIAPFGQHAGANGMFSTTAYAIGSYQVNPRLTFSGGSWIESNNMKTLFEPQMNSQAFNMNNKGIMFGMDYRVTENLHFGAQVRVSSGYSPLYNPFLQRQSLFNSSTNPGW